MKPVNIKDLPYEPQQNRSRKVKTMARKWVITK